MLRTNVLWACLAALTFVACLGASAEKAVVTPSVGVGDAALPIALEGSDGQTYNLDDLRGEKNLLVIFFRGSW